MPIKKHYPFSFFMACCLLLASVAGRAQTSDQVKYYIAYDGSGSIALVDKGFNNQQALLKALVSVTNGNINSGARFTLYQFGEKAIKRSDYLPDASTTGKQQARQRLDKTTPGEKYSHVDQALTQILQAVQKDTAISKGVFLFTDGLLKEKDFDNKLYASREQYVQQVQSLIGQIQAVTGKPVFLIQTAPTTANPFFKSLGIGQVNQLVSQGFIREKNFFWLSSRTAFKPGSPADSAFANFIDYSNQLIMASTQVPPNDQVAAAITAQEIFLSGRLDIKQDLKTADASALAVLQQLKTTLNQNTLSQADLKIINQALKQLAAQPGPLEKINETARKKAAGLSASLAEAFVPEPGVALTEAGTQSANLGLEEKLILGLADYVIDRATKEVLYSFTEELDKRLFNNPKEPRLSQLCRDYLFPSFYELIQEQNVTTDPVMLRAALKKDLMALPGTVIAQDNFKLTEGLTALAGFTYLFEQVLYQGDLEKAFQSLGSRMEAYAASRFLQIEKQQNGKIRTALVFTARLIGNLEKYNFIHLYNHHPEKLQELSKMLIALSLDSAMLGSVDSVKVDNAVNLVKSTYDNYSLVKKQIESLQKLLKNPPQTDYTGYRQYQAQIIKDILQRAGALMLSGTGLLKQIYFKGDSAAFRETSILAATRNAEKAVDMWFALKDGHYTEVAFVMGPELVQSLTLKLNPTLQNLVYIAGEAGVAQNPADVQKVIAKYALPVASYKTKYANQQTLMLNAYAGFAGVHYFTKDVKPGISAPIGLDWSFKACKKFPSVSILAGLIDIGNIIDYQLFDREAEADTDAVSFQRIFSPGLFSRIGLGRSIPLALLGGYQMNPKRVSLGLTVDLPLAGFWNKSFR